MKTSVDSTLSFFAGLLFCICVLIQFDHVFNLFWVYDLLSLMPSFPRLSGTMVLGAALLMMVSYGLAWLPEISKKRSAQQSNLHQEVLWNLMAYLMIVISVSLNMWKALSGFFQRFEAGDLAPLIMETYFNTEYNQVMAMVMVIIAMVILPIGCWAFIQALALVKHFYAIPSSKIEPSLSAANGIPRVPSRYREHKSFALQVFAAVMVAVYLSLNCAAKGVPEIESAFICGIPCLKPFVFFGLYWVKLMLVCLTLMLLLQFIVRLIRQKKHLASEYRSRILIAISSVMLILSLLMVMPTSRPFLVLVIEFFSFILLVFFIVKLFQSLILWFSSGVHSLTYVLGGCSEDDLISRQKARLNLLRIAVIILGLLLLRVTWQLPTHAYLSPLHGQFRHTSCQREGASKPMSEVDSGTFAVEPLEKALLCP